MSDGQLKKIKISIDPSSGSTLWLKKMAEANDLLAKWYDKESNTITISITEYNRLLDAEKELIGHWRGVSVDLKHFMEWLSGQFGYTSNNNNFKVKFSVSEIELIIDKYKKLRRL